jgi:hypothetical protein
LQDKRDLPLRHEDTKKNHIIGEKAREEKGKRIMTVGIIKKEQEDL